MRNPSAALTGQIAGLAIRGGALPERLPAEQVQREMRRRGIPCHLEDL